MYQLSSEKDERETYDRILGAYLNEENLNESWVVLQSQQYDKIHLVKLRDCDSFRQEEKTPWRENKEERHMGGKFVKAPPGEELLIKVCSH